MIAVGADATLAGAHDNDAWGDHHRPASVWTASAERATVPAQAAPALGARCRNGAKAESHCEHNSQDLNHEKSHRFALATITTAILRQISRNTNHREINAGEPEFLKFINDAAAQQF
jgi:hypothetical protein